MDPMNLEQRFCAHNYHPLPVVLTRGLDVWLWDDHGRRYLDMMSAYSAVSHGHAHPRLVQALTDQAHRLAVPSRAYYSDRLGPLAARLCRLSGLDAMLPMNTGAEAVETAIKAARRWGYQVRNIPEGQAEIIVAAGNFHGRTTTIVGFSSEADYRRDFGPFAPGFRAVPFGDAAAVAAAITANTCAVLVEPIQGEAGIIVPPDGWLTALRRLCDQHGILLILDEVQSGLGRTGRWFAFEHESEARPDGLILGKALGGGLLPVSAFLARADVMATFTPGSHGSTFGGNPLAAAVALEALAVLEDQHLVERSAVLGRHMLERLRRIDSPAIAAVRGRGLWAGVELTPMAGGARMACERLAARGILTKETHDTVIRLAPPLTISRADLDGALDTLEEVLHELAPHAVGGRSLSGGWPAARLADPVATDDAATLPQILMCAPEHFTVSYAINPWMDPGQWSPAAAALSHQARTGWQTLHDAYVALGAVVDVMPAEPGLPDLVFTANAAVVLDRIALMARFRHPERQGEEAPNRRFFEQLQQSGRIDRIEVMPDGAFFEGAGDAVWDAHRRMFWVGHGPRSSAGAGAVVARVFGQTVVPLRLVDPRFYHLDTCLCVLPGGEVLYYPGAFDDTGNGLLGDLVGADRLIAATPADAGTLAVNAFAVGHHLLMGSCSADLQATLEVRGYRVHRMPLAAFARSGGSAFCLTLRLDRRAVATGLNPGEGRSRAGVSRLP
ncbi:MAG: ornithine--oxo-acid transaminase [Azospirillaceae bacterium]|nr:ornithine--oxo-acid transaminase [Azospirillaceae bacterium]